jgi:hypothetical protein
MQIEPPRSFGVGKRVVLGRAIATSHEEHPTVVEGWHERRLGIPLAMSEAPFRDDADLPRSEVREHMAAGDTIVTVVLPEFVPERRWQQLLHNQTAFALERLLLFEPNVMVTSVPFHLRDEDRG